VGSAWPVTIKVADEELIIADNLTVEGIKVLAAIEVLQIDVTRKAARSCVKPHHHPVNRKGEARQKEPLHYAGGRRLHLVFCRHLQVCRLVLANGPRNTLNDTAHGRLGNTTTKARRALEMATSIVVECNQDLL
jgi:hypothetical protein